MISLKSAVTRKLLAYFFINPQQSLYINELWRKLQLDKRNLVKKINELEREGILRHDTRGNLKLYSINKNYHFYGEYKKIIMKTTGFDKQLRDAVDQTKGVKEAYIYGSYAKNKIGSYSDIDLLVVGNHSIAELQRKLNKLQSDISREINVINIGEKEFKKRIKDRDPFFLSILKQKHIKIV